jgi:ferredoxin, 2Fe-2S
MPKIVLIASDGCTTEIEASAGKSVMEAAVLEGVSGVIGECGGSAMCATCHVYVDPGVLGKLSPMRPEEDAMLDGTASERRENSRLGCQIKITEELDGAVFHLPESQI